MTINRKPGSIEDALKAAVGDLSPGDILAATGLKHSTFLKLSNPLSGGSLDFDDAAALEAALIKAGKPPRFLTVFQDIVTSVLDRLGGADAPHTDFARSLRRLDIESGALAEAIDDALADGHVDEGERRRIARAAQNVIDHAREIRDAAEPPHPVAVPIRSVQTRTA